MTDPYERSHDKVIPDGELENSAVNSFQSNAGSVEEDDKITLSVVAASHHVKPEKCTDHVSHIEQSSNCTEDMCEGNLSLQTDVESVLNTCTESVVIDDLHKDDMVCGECESSSISNDSTVSSPPVMQEEHDGSFTGRVCLVCEAPGVDRLDDVLIDYNGPAGGVGLNTHLLFGETCVSDGGRTVRKIVDNIDNEVTGRLSPHSRHSSQVCSDEEREHCCSAHKAMKTLSSHCVGSELCVSSNDMLHNEAKFPVVCHFDVSSSYDELDYAHACINSDIMQTNDGYVPVLFACDENNHMKVCNEKGYHVSVCKGDHVQASSETDLCSQFNQRDVFPTCERTDHFPAYDEKCDLGIPTHVEMDVVHECKNTNFAHSCDVMDLIPEFNDRDHISACDIRDVDNVFKEKDFSKRCVDTNSASPCDDSDPGEACSKTDLFQTGFEKNYLPACDDWDVSSKYFKVDSYHEDDRHDLIPACDDQKHDPMCDLNANVFLFRGKDSVLECSTEHIFQKDDKTHIVIICSKEDFYSDCGRESPNSACDIKGPAPEFSRMHPTLVCCHSHSSSACEHYALTSECYEANTNPNGDEKCFPLACSDLDPVSKPECMEYASEADTVCSTTKCDMAHMLHCLTTVSLVDASISYTTSFTAVSCSSSGVAPDGCIAEAIFGSHEDKLTIPCCQKSVSCDCLGTLVSVCCDPVSSISITASDDKPLDHRRDASSSHSDNEPSLSPDVFLNIHIDDEDDGCDDDDNDNEASLTELDMEYLNECSSSHQRVSEMPSLMSMLKEFLPGDSVMCEIVEEYLSDLHQKIIQKDKTICRLEEQKDLRWQLSMGVIAGQDVLVEQRSVLEDSECDGPFLSQLECIVAQQQNELRQIKDKLTSHDAAARHAINTLQNEMQARIEQLSKMYEDSQLEKDALVMKFAEAETRTLDAVAAMHKVERRVRDILKEKESTEKKMRSVVADRQKSVQELNGKINELNHLQKSMSKLREDTSSNTYRSKWFQNKLASEEQAHKEARCNLERVTAKLRQAKEETDMIRKDCQDIVKTYQESEEVRSNCLDKKLRLRESELTVHMRERSQMDEVYTKTQLELESVRGRHREALTELYGLRSKTSVLDEERLIAEEMKIKYEAIMQTQKSDNVALGRKLADLSDVQDSLRRAQEAISDLDGQLGQLRSVNHDLQKEMNDCRCRESDLLTLQSELSRTNALLRSDNCHLRNQVVTLSGQVQTMKMEIQDLETRCRNLDEQLTEERNMRTEETSVLVLQLTECSAESEQYKQKWYDEVDACRTLKRKHVNSVKVRKDITRQLQQARRQLDTYESGHVDREVTSIGSSANSSGSLNSTDNQNTVITGQAQHPDPQIPVVSERAKDDMERQLLIERIVRLQRSLARKSDKLDFLDDHIQQLVFEIRKKNRIIQNYILRENVGTLASDIMDANKLAAWTESQALLMRKGGIMASIYSQHQKDGTMTLDLSLEISRKLQAVLEDTLLKNMTLKENLDTLGGEIAHLSRENRQLQLHIKGEQIVIT